MHFIRVVARCATGLSRINGTRQAQRTTLFLERTGGVSITCVLMRRLAFLSYCWVLAGPRCIYTFMGRYACHIVVQFPGGVLLTTTDHALLIADLLRACRVYSLKKGNPLEARVARYIRTRYASTHELAQSRAPAAFFY